MSSLFDATVYLAKAAIPWATINFEHFLRDLAQNTFDDVKPVTLSVISRPSVSTRCWWVLTWTGEDGEERTIAASTLELCLWRAAVREKQLRSKAERTSQEVV